MLRQKRKVNRGSSSNYKLSSSASTNSMHTLPRPKSYVPFQGCVETPPPPPGRGMHEILHALSYAPTHESFSEETQSSNLLRIPPPTITQPIPPQRKIAQVKKSRSFASLMCHNVPDETNFGIDPVLYVQTENEPVYAPTNPLNHPENHAVFNVHPPVIYPPPDLVPSSTFRPKSPVVLKPSQSSPKAGNHLVRRSNSSLGSSGSPSSASSGFETARSSSSTSSGSMSSINVLGFQSHHQSNNVLESIRETSPMISSSRF